MKLLTKINRNYLTLLSVMLIIISIAGYFIIKLRFQYEAKEKLLQTAELIHEQIRQTGVTTNLPPVIEVRRRYPLYQIGHRKLLQNIFLCIKLGGLYLQVLGKQLIQPVYFVVRYYF